jgi:addiction module HigA family antidote
MDEYQITTFSLAKAIKLSPAGTRLFVTGKTKVSVSTALRLAKLFGQTPAFWLDLQRDTDLAAASKDKELQDVVKGISRAKKPVGGKATGAKKAGKK